MEKFVYFVTSDIHSDASVLSALLDRAKEERADGFFIAGDLCPSSPEFLPLLTSAPFPIYTVKGNSDSLWDYRDMNLAIPREVLTVQVGEMTIAMTHGHTISLPQELPITLKKGDIFITGHTHVPLIEKLEGGVIHLNPGSPVRPRSAAGATYAVITERNIEIRTAAGRIVSALCF